MANNEQFYEKQLGIAYWYVTHKLLLKNILIAFLIVLDFCVIAFNVYLLVLNLSLNQKSYQANLVSLISTNPSYAISRQAILPKPIQVGQITTYPDMKNYDIVAEISNPNDKWLATFDYQFKIGQNLTEKRSGFIFPSEQKKVLDLAVESGNAASELIISNTQWQKEIDFATIYKEKFKFNVSDIKFIPGSELGIGQQGSVSRATFTVANDTAYSYKNVDFILWLEASGQITAVNLANSGEFLAGQTKQLESTFFQRLPRITSVEVVPEVNIFDEENFLKI